MRRIITYLLSFLAIGCQAQDSQPQRCMNPAFDKKVNSLIRYSVPVVTPAELVEMGDDVLVLDAREMREYKVSHIPGAVYIGYDDFDEDRILGAKKDQQIVVYCSVGYRSEKIGERLQKLGYRKVNNLFGSIFEWVNQGHPLENNQEESASLIHTYNKKWGKWMENPEYEKVYK